MSEPFTVRWAYEVDGIQRERLIEADTVHASYDARTPDKHSAQGAMLGIYRVSEGGLVVIGNPYLGADSMALAFGTVYVMNRDGKTVAKYILQQDVQRALAINAAMGNPNPMPPDTDSLAA